MSYSKPVKYSQKGLNLQIVNTYVAVHDLNCGCNEPLTHIIKQIQEQEPSVKKWPTTTDTGDAHGQEDGVDGLGEGELEALFADGDAENTTG